MNQDVIIDAGLNVGKVAGLDKVYEQLRQAATRGITDGISVGAARAQENLVQYRAMRAAPGSTSVAEQLGRLVAMRTRLNAASAVASSLSPTAAVSVATERELLNREINQVRSILKKSPNAKWYVSPTDKRGNQLDIGLYGDKVVTREKALESEFNAALKTWSATQELFASGEYKKLPKGKQALLAERGIKEADRVYGAAQALDEYRAEMRSKKKALITPEEEDEYRDTKKTLKAIAGNTQKTSTATTALLQSAKTGIGIFTAGAAGSRIAQQISSDIGEYYGSEQPFTTLRNKLFKRTTTGGTAIGAATGAGVGGLLGAVLTTLTGGAAAPLIPYLVGGGGAIGGFLTNLWLNSKMSNAVAAATQSQNTALQTMRYKGLYGATSGQGGWQFAKAVEASGLATAGDVETLASNAQEFQAALAFGGVSDSQMLGMSMLPNYYAAMASGATPEQAFSAYMQDVQGMSPGLAQYASKLAGVPDNLRALANNPELANRVLTEGYGTSVGLEAEMRSYTGGFAGAHYSLGLENLKEQRVQWAKAMDEDNVASEYNYDPRYSTQAFHYDEGRYIKYDAASAPKYTSPTGLGPADQKGDDFVKRELNIYVGEQKTTIGHVYTDKEVNDQISYAIGAM